MKTIELVTAVILAIKSFGNTTFSIWNLTTKIRDDVRTLQYDLVDTGTSVYHDHVKLAFEELNSVGIVEFHDVTTNPNGYREYTIMASSPTDSGQAPTNVPTKVDTKLPDVKTVSTSSIFPMDVQKKMYTYIKNNGPVTMKQIQSRLKGYPYTCEDIKDFLSKLYLIDPATNTNPTSQMVTIKF